jgi:hypothetical protein
MEEEEPEKAVSTLQVGLRVVAAAAAWFFNRRIAQRESSSASTYLVLDGRVAEIVDEHMTLGSGNNGKRIGHVHAIGTLGQVHSGRGRG